MDKTETFGTSWLFRLHYPCTLDGNTCYHFRILYEAIHLVAFLAFLFFSIWQLASGRTTGMGFVLACVVYVLLILSPVLLQRYNRLRVYEAIRRMRKKQVSL